MFTIVGMRKCQVTRDLKHQRHRVNIHTRGSEKDAIPIGRDRAKAKPQRMRKQKRRNIRKSGRRQCQESKRIVGFSYERVGANFWAFRKEGILSS
ncbi:hypothetical protein H4I96_09822 [Botrytis cinerea]